MSEIDAYEFLAKKCEKEIESLKQKLDKALKVIDMLKETSEHYADLANDIVIDYKMTKIEVDELIKELRDE
jgi:regulatory protein YycH of two-component signal transduction system YycFG